MSFLEALAAHRSPAPDGFFSLCSMLGEEVFFALIIFGALWVADKRAGFWMFFAWISGSALCNFLKIAVASERPWVQNPELKPVEGALKKATGYSFPSGHSQSAAGLFGSLAWELRKKALYFVSAAAIVLCAFSRLYLGVHFPIDVLAGLAVGLLAVALMARLQELEKKRPAVSAVCCALLVALAGASVLYGALTKTPQGETADAWKLLGASVGLAAAWQADRLWIRFDTRAVWYAQVLKCAIGGALALLIMEGLKQPLLALFSGHNAAHALRYLLTALFAGLAWPATFGWWARMGGKTR